MSFRQKLAFFALGAAFVLAGQVLVALIASNATAQGGPESGQFDTVRARRLIVEDVSGVPGVQIEATENGGIVRILGPGQRDRAQLAATKDGSVLVLMHEDGARGVEIGTLPQKQGTGITIYADDGRPRVQAIEFNGNGVVRTMSSRTITGSLPGRGMR